MTKPIHLAFVFIACRGVCCAQVSGGSGSQNIGVNQGLAVNIQVPEKHRNRVVLRGKLAVNVDSAIVAEVHTRGMWNAKGEAMQKPEYQELFHDWTIKLDAVRVTSATTITIRDARRPNDRVHVEPSATSVSEPEPRWVSGFSEPSHAPDYFVRTIKFDRLIGTAKIVLRRPIKSRDGVNTLSTLDLDLDREISASAKNADVSVQMPPRGKSPYTADSEHFRQLGLEMTRLSSERTFGTVNTRLNPDEPPPALKVQEDEIIWDLQCKLPMCNGFTAAVISNRTRIN